MGDPTEARHYNVVPHAQGWDKALPPTILWSHGYPEEQHLAGAWSRNWLSANNDPSAVRVVQSHNATQDGRSARTQQPSESEDFVSAQCKADIRKSAVLGEMLHFEDCVTE
jgi:hypothetical protein